MSFDDDLRKELQQRLDPIGAPAEWEPVRERMSAARARRDRTRAAIAGTAAACLAFGGIALAWNDRQPPVGAASHPSTVQPSPGPTPEPGDVRAIDAPAETSAALPPGRMCPDGWRFFVNPVLHFDLCYPDDWGFSSGSDEPNLEVIPGDDLREGINLRSPRYPLDGDPGGLYDAERIHVSFWLGAPAAEEGECRDLPVMGAVGRACERFYSPGADSVEFGPDQPVHGLDGWVPLTVRPSIDPSIDPQRELRLTVEARRELWDEHQDTIEEILASIRPHQSPPADELTLPIKLLAVAENSIDFEARLNSCETFDRVDVNETPTSVQVRAVAIPYEVEVYPNGLHGDVVCFPGRHPFTVELTEPLAQRQLDYAIVSRDYQEVQQLQGCPHGRLETHGGPRFPTAEEAASAALEELGSLPLTNAVQFASGQGERAWIIRNAGRTLASVTVEFRAWAKTWGVRAAASCRPGDR